MICQYRYDPRRDDARFKFAHACTSLDLVRCGYAIDDSIRRGLKEGVEALDVLALGLQYRARTDGMFSARMLEADQFLELLESAPGSKPLIDAVIERRADLEELLDHMLNRDLVKQLRDYFFSLTTAFMAVCA